MQIEGAWIKNDATQAVFAALESDGYEAYFVGGCVRNALMGFHVDDLDIATNAHPNQIIISCEKQGLRCIPTGIDHGTITVVSGGVTHEVTTYRQDILGDGRHAVVEFSASMLEDASRRDFTMNALYADRFGKVYDPLGCGETDLQNKRVTFIGDAAQRITEDYLRILRYFRFTAIYADPNHGFDPETLSVIAANQDGLDRLSKERIGSEMQKLLSASDPAPAISAMRSCCILRQILPGSDDEKLGPLVHLETLCGVQPNWIRRLAILGGIDTRNALRMRNDDTQKFDQMRDGIGNMVAAHALGYRYGTTMGHNILLVRWANFEHLPNEVDWKDAEFGAHQTFPIRAHDLMSAYSGAALGQELRRLEQKWIDSKFTLGKEALLHGN